MPEAAATTAAATAAAAAVAAAAAAAAAVAMPEDRSTGMPSALVFKGFYKVPNVLFGRVSKVR